MPVGEFDMVPAAIDALRAAWGSAAALAGVQVLDGEPVTYVGGEYLTVGMSGDDAAVEATSARAGMGRRRQGAATVACGLWSASGNTVAKAHRDRVFALFAAAATVVREDPTLGGAVTRASVAAYTYRPRRNAKGAGAAVEFTVDVQML